MDTTRQFESKKNIMHRCFRCVANLALIFVGIMGLRLDSPRRWKYLGIWFSLWIGVVFIYVSIFEFQLVNLDERTLKVTVFTYAGLIWFTYYFGMTVVLGSRLRLLLIEKLGEDRAYQLWQLSLGIVFLNQGFCQMVVIKTFGTSFPFFLPQWLIILASGFLTLSGIICKVWATYLTGLDTYYYKDLFLNRITHVGELEPFVKSGPYRYLGNPMYGVGNFQAYGAAIWYQSWPGLVIAVVFQISIYIFCFLIERPFVHSTYLKSIAISDPKWGIWFTQFTKMKRMKA